MPVQPNYDRIEGITLFLPDDCMTETKNTGIKQRVLEQWPLVNRLAERRFGPGLGEEAALWVLDNLALDDWRRLREYRGRAGFPGFLAVVVSRLLEDFARRKFGRVRPPGWIRSLGGMWRLLFELLCLRRLSVQEAVTSLRVQRPEISEKEGEQAAWAILERVVNCGAHQGLESSLTDENGGELAGEGGPEQELAARDREIFLTLLFGEEKLVEQGSALLDRLRDRIRLSDEERLLLILCFREELSVTRAGAMLGMNPNQAHGRLRRLLARLRKDFDRAGVSADLRAMLQ